MNLILKRIRQFLFYGGLEKEQYKEISADIDEANRKSIVFLSIAAFVILLIRLLLKYSAVPQTNQIVFIIAICLFALIAAANSLIKRNHFLIHSSAYIFIAVYLAVGIISAISEGSIQERTTLYLAFVVSAPMLYELNAVELAAVIVPAEAVYLFLIAKFQSEYPVYITNVGNSLFFSIVGLGLGVYMANKKISGIYNAYMNTRMEDIKALNEQLDQNKKELQIALASAEHANRAKTVFLNNMSHDIRTPMNAIIGFTSLAATHLDNQEQVKEYLGKIMTSSQHLLSLINDVLDMSRIEAGKVKLEEKSVHLPDLVHDLRTINQMSISSKRIDFFIDTLDVADEDIITDPLRLNQVLMNILSNAIKYTQTGGTITFRIIQKNNGDSGYADYEFHIKDNGIGMSEEFQKHIFEEFTREQTSTVNHIQGTGLGMSITKSIVDMMGGSITVSSEVGKGSEFVVSLRFMISGEKTEFKPVPQLKGMRALVADDDTNTCLSVSTMLSKIGMRSDWTTSGKEAVVRAKYAIDQNDEFHAYIIDWLIPDMNGIEVVRRIRKVIGESCPIIILTAYDWADIETEAKEAGVTAFCSKPLFLSELRDALSKPFIHTEKSEVRNEKIADFIGKNILLVEDNELNKEIAVTILEEKGFSVDTANDGTVAVEKMEKADKGTYDLILMDVQMPIMDGYEATRRIRNFKDTDKASIPIIAMTANAFEEDRQNAVNAGMNGHIAKPIDVSILMQELKNILKHK